MAGGSQIIINKDGIKIITPARFEAKAGQHLFKSGVKINYSLPDLPEVSPLYSNKVDVYNIFANESFKNVENLNYSVLYDNGEFKKGSLDKYGRTNRIKSSEKKNVKVLIGGDEWHYYIRRLGGSVEDITYIKFIDFIGEPIPNLEFCLHDENNKLIVKCQTNQYGEAAFQCVNDGLPLLLIKKIIGNEYKPIIRIDTNIVREILFISPKILKDVELLPESDKEGDYLRSNYSE